ncbi:hypothetical protein WJX72_008981 [[Myrmecia] bisecta]|uniref:Protein kinase domain-containing protein n=1 Tax=[Myrmecia] bisecta TaxID=41462 RepID=A0AAW1P9Z2_9CHLO
MSSRDLIEEVTPRECASDRDTLSTSGIAAACSLSACQAAAAHRQWSCVLAPAAAPQASRPLWPGQISSVQHSSSPSLQPKNSSYPSAMGFGCFGGSNSRKQERKSSSAPELGASASGSREDCPVADKGVCANLSDPNALSQTTRRDQAAARPPPAAPPQESVREPLKGLPTYKKLYDINHGSSGFVQLAEHRRTGEHVAIKFIPQGSESVKRAEKEILNMRLCNLHPHIIQFYEVFLTPAHVAIAIEYADCGDLADYLAAHRISKQRQKGLRENTARWFFQQTIVALDFCHAMGIANRDIKLENCLLVSNPNARDWPLLKLCDFGFSKDEYTDSLCKTACGTPEYVAPEVLQYSKYDGKIADIWSCGVLLYVMVTGSFPFRSSAESKLNPMVQLQQMFPRIVAADYERPKHVSADCRNLMERMLTADCSKRITMGEILGHPWFRQGLPSHLASLNEELLALSETAAYGMCRQDEAEILRITGQANMKAVICVKPTKRPGSAAKPGGKGPSQRQSGDDRGKGLAGDAKPGTKGPSYRQSGDGQPLEPGLGSSLASPRSVLP